MVQEIMSHNGDILKFSGDAFVVVWKQTESVPMRDVVHAAIDCGLIIQKSYGSYDTDVDVTIRGISINKKSVEKRSNNHNEALLSD